MHVVTNPRLTPELRDALVALWTAVTNAGGAVGLVAPTTPEDVMRVAQPAFARVEAGNDDLVVAFDDGQPVGLGFLETNPTDLTAHWATVRRLQRAPSQAGQGIGVLILDELEAAARRRGLRYVTLTTRGGTGRERFYLARGYTVDASLPNRLHVGEGRLVDELRLSKPLDATVDGVYLPVQQLDPRLPLPRYAHPGDAGLDLYTREAVTLKPGERAVVPTGVALAIPYGYVGLVHPRSGLAARHGVTLVNAPGTIDAGYRGEVKVIVANTDATEPVVLERGARVAQLLIQRVEAVQVVAVTALPDTARGKGGFGSTGS